MDAVSVVESTLDGPAADAAATADGEAPGDADAAEVPASGAESGVDRRDADEAALAADAARFEREFDPELDDADEPDPTPEFPYAVPEFDFAEIAATADDDEGLRGEVFRYPESFVAVDAAVAEEPGGDGSDAGRDADADDPDREGSAVGDGGPGRSGAPAGDGEDQARR